MKGGNRAERVGRRCRGCIQVSDLTARGLRFLRYKVGVMIPSLKGCEDQSREWLLVQGMCMVNAGCYLLF